MEDSPTQARLAVETLGQITGVALHVANNLAGFVNSFHRHSPDLVVSDIVIPDVEPEALITSLKVIGKPVVFWSASDEYCKICKVHGLRCVSKLADIDELVSAVRDELDMLKCNCKGGYGMS